MSTLYVSEYSQILSDIAGAVQIGMEPAIAEQALSIGGGSTPSAAFNAATRFVRLHTDAVCSVSFGPSPVAVATAKRMAANTTEYFGVQAGQKVAVISNS